MTDLTLREGRALAVPDADRAFTAEEARAVEAAMDAAWSEETRRAYRREWRAFLAFCAASGRQPLPAAPQTVATYFAARAHAASKSALVQARAIITHMHRVRLGQHAPTEEPAVQHALRGARRLAARRQPEQQKAPLTMREMQTLLARVDRVRLSGKRDAALLLVGFATAMRRSELVAILAEHCRCEGETLLVVIPRSKTDQEGKGAVVAVQHWHPPGRVVDLCPVCALREWLWAANITEGPLFRGVLKGQWGVRETALHDGEVSRIVKRYASAVGLDPERFAGHSLRAGFVTEAFRRGYSEARIMGQTRHESVATLMKYRREANPTERGIPDITK